MLLWSIFRRYFSGATFQALPFGLYFSGSTSQALLRRFKGNGKRFVRFHSGS
jgi:hypothetical protein